MDDLWLSGVDGFVVYVVDEMVLLFKMQILVSGPDKWS